MPSGSGINVTVHTHFPCELVVLDGETTFHFVTGEIHETLRLALSSADGKDVHIGGGAATIKQCLDECLVDETHVAIAPTILGTGERVFGDVNLRLLGYTCTQHVASEHATHLVLTRSVG